MAIQGVSTLSAFLVILNPTTMVILMAKFNPTITAYLVPYIIEWHENFFCYWVSLLAKVEHISYTMGTRALPDIYALAHGITITYVPIR